MQGKFSSPMPPSQRRPSAHTPNRTTPRQPQPGLVLLPGGSALRICANTRASRRPPAHTPGRPSGGTFQDERHTRALYNSQGHTPGTSHLSLHRQAGEVRERRDLVGGERPPTRYAAAGSLFWPSGHLTHQNRQRQHRHRAPGEQATDRLPYFRTDYVRYT